MKKSKIMTSSLLISTLFLAFINPALSIPVSPKGLESPSIQVSPAAEAYNKGLAALGKNDFKFADTAFKESLKLDANFVPSILGLAHVAIKQNKSSEADQWLNKALQVAPNDPTVHTSLGRYQFSQRQFQKAEASFKKAIALDAKAVPPRVELGDVYLNGLRKYKEAIAAYNDAISIQPTHAGAYFGLGSAFMASNNLPDAIKAFEKSSSLAPDNPLPLQSLGYAYALRKENTKALESFDKVLKVKPDFVMAYVDKGDVYALMGKDAEALKEYQTAVKASPKFADAHLKQSMIYQKQKQWANAQAALLKVIEIDPKHALALNNLAWITTEQKTRLDDGVKWAQKAVELVPDNPEFQDTLGWVLYNRKDSAQAISVLEKASRLKTPSAGVFYHLGILYSEAGRNKDAITALKKSISINSSSVDAADAKARLNSLSAKN